MAYTKSPRPYKKEYQQQKKRGEHPDRMEWWSRMDDQAGGSFHKSRTYKELGNFVQAQGDWIFDNEAFLCQADGGECTG